MATADLARNIVGILGNIIALFLFLSPLPTFVRIWKKGSVEQYSPVPYLATLLNCMVWVLYGLPMVHPNSTLVLTINVAGVGIELVFLILFFIHSDKKKRLKLILILLLELIFVAVLSLLVLTLAHGTKRRSMIVGIVCICFCIVMYASPLSVMKMVISTKSVEYMPFSLSLAAFGNSLAWSCYALILFDPFILIPNGLGALFAMVQLIVYAMFYKSTKRIKAAREGTKDDHMNSSRVIVMVNANEDSNNSNKPDYARQNGHVSDSNINSNSNMVQSPFSL